MIRSQLNSYSGADPIWGFVALIGSERYTGEAAVGIDPRVRLFAVDGRVYFAEREGDAPIGTRLVNCGAVSTTQLERGAVQIGETSSLARFFQREPSIDRDEVELTIELATESLLASVANKAVGMPEVFPLRHHSSGVHHWLRSTATPAAPALPVAEQASSTPAASIVEEAPAVEETPAIAEASTVDETPIAEETFAVEERHAVEEAPDVEETPAIEEDVVEEPFMMEEVFALEAPAQVEAVVEEAVVEEAVVEEPFVMEEVFALEAPAQVEAVVEEAVVEEPVVEEAVVETVADKPTTSSFVALTAMSLPTLSSMTGPADVTEEAVAEGLPTTGPLQAPMPTLASLTLPTLSASTPEAASEPIVAVEPTLASTSADLFSSLPEPATFAPTNPYDPAEPPIGLPTLASAPVSMSDLVVANVVPASPFGEPTHNLAAVDIWQMVDVLTDDGRDGEKDLVGSGSSEKQGRSWLRGRKG